MLGLDERDCFDRWSGTGTVQRLAEFVQIRLRPDRFIGHDNVMFPVNLVLEKTTLKHVFMFGPGFAMFTR